MSIPPDCKRVPSTGGVVTGNPDAGRKTMLIPPDCKRVSGSGATIGATDAGWEIMSIPADCAHRSGIGVVTDTTGPDRETMPIPSDCERVPGTDGDASDHFFAQFYVDGGILVEVRFFQDGQVVTGHRVPCVLSLSIARPPRSTGPPPVGSALDVGVEYAFGGARLGS